MKTIIKGMNKNNIYFIQNIMVIRTQFCIERAVLLTQFRTSLVVCSTVKITQEHRDTNVKYIVKKQLFK